LNSARNEKIFTGATSQAQEILDDALGGEFDLIFCNNLDHARMLLAEPVSAIICTVRFDGSRMFDLLRYVRANPATRSIPFVGLRVLQGALPIHEVAAATTAARLLGANDFVDFCTWMHDLGNEAAYQKLRATVRQFL
jgi:response regulator RpfG family c-di-GMP phosphodiesterase